MASSTSSRPAPCLGIFLAAALLSGASGGPVQAAPSPCAVQWQRGVLTVTASDAPRAACLGLIAQRTGMKVSGLENVGGTISIQLSTPGVRDAIPRLADGVSYTLIENDPDHSGDPKTLVVHFIGAGSAAGSRTPDIMRGQLVSVAQVEDPDSGLMQAQELPPAESTPAGRVPRPDDRPVDVQVQPED